MKRSVSPLSFSGDEGKPKKRKYFSILSAVKNVFAKPSPTKPASEISRNFEKQGIHEEPLPNSFVSSKRKMSIIESNKHMKQAVPRSSIVSNKDSGYGLLYNSVKTSQEKDDTLQEHMWYGADAENSLIKEISPTVHVPKTRVLPTLSREFDIFANEPSDPFLASHDEFNSVYQDEQGNLIRPPLINLDPRERYHMLQLKKSREASDYIQHRLKYMIDPQETASTPLANNKVDSVTQTHNRDYLAHSLNFNELKTKLALRNRKARKAKSGLGVFSGEFFYEPAKSKDSAKLATRPVNSLGVLNLPQFKTKESSNIAKTLPDEDIRQNISRRRGSMSQRPGLEEALRHGKKDDKLDPDFVEKVEKAQGLFKIKESPAVSSNVSIGPSSAFNFEISKAKLEPILNQTNSESTQPSVNLTCGNSSKDNFTKEVDLGATSKLAAANSKDPKFSSGRTPMNNSHKLSDLASTQNLEEEKLNFPGSVADTTNLKQSSLTLGSTQRGDLSTPLSANKEGSHTQNEATFSLGNFGKSDFSKDNAKSKPLFNLDSNLPKSNLSFGSVSSSSKPLLPDDRNDNTAFSLDSKTKPTSDAAVKPAFSFGSNLQNHASNDSKEKPIFSFSSNSKPTSADGPEGKGTLSFGLNSNTNTNSTDGSQDKPTFIFGSKSASANESNNKQESTKQDDNQNNTKGESFKNSSNLFNQNVHEEPNNLLDSKSSAPSNQNILPSSKHPVGEEVVDKVTKGLDEKPIDSPRLFGDSSTLTSASSGKHTMANDPAKNTQFSFGPLSNQSTTTALGGEKQNTFFFGNPTPNTANSPASTATSGDNGRSQSAKNEHSSFSFGQTATADPASIFGNQSTSIPTPAFNFSVKPTSKESPPFQGGIPPTFPKSTGGFNFSNKALSGLGDSRPMTPSNAGFSFGSGQGVGGVGGPQPVQTPSFGGFSNATAPPSVFGGFSRSATPGGTFEQGPIAQQGFGQQASIPQNGFSFSNGNPTNASVFNSAPGSFGHPSRENTPPAFGMGNLSTTSGQSQAYTPPVANVGNKRIIAQMRQRKRF